MSGLVAYDTSPFEIPLPPGHPFPMRKYRMLREAVAAAGLHGLLRTAPRAELGWVLEVHDRAYVRRVLHGRLSAAEVRRLGLPWSPELAERALRSCGATAAACGDARARGVGLVLGGGGHHALRAAGRGFCVFNDLAVGVRFAQRAGARRVLVVDCDVHQGDGTAALFAHDPTVFTFSLHARGNFPFDKARSDLDVELPDGAGDEVYLRALGETLPGVLRTFRPDLVLYVAGADPLAGDRMGRLGLSGEGLAHRDRFVLGLARAQGVPVAVTLGGGYGEPLEETVRAHLRTVREVLRAFEEVGQPLGRGLAGSCNGARGEL